MSVTLEQAVDLSGLAARSPLEVHPADQDRDHRDEVELPDQRFEYRQHVAKVARSRVVAVADRRESHEAEVQTKSRRAVSALSEERAGVEHGDDTVGEQEEHSEQEV